MKRLISFSAEWCGPCQSARKIFNDKLAPGEFIYVDVESAGIIVNKNAEAGEKDEILDGVVKAKDEVGRLFHYPTFAIVDDDYKVVARPKSIGEVLSHFRTP